jgi:hypothetical protein
MSAPRLRLPINVSVTPITAGETLPRHHGSTTVITIVTNERESLK